MSKTELNKANDDSEDNDFQQYDYSPEELEEAGYRTFDPSEDETSGEAQDWLEENDPGYLKPDKSKHEEYANEQDEDAHIKGVKEDAGDLGEDQELIEPSSAKQAKIGKETSPQKTKELKSRYIQPTKEELNDLRQHTMPYERRMRRMQASEAVPEKNPELALYGNLLEANSATYGNRQKAYQNLINSDEYKKADPLTQMEMDDKFHKDWTTNNPNFGENAVMEHHKAHQKGIEGQQKFKQAKQAQIQHIIGGGVGGEEEPRFSTEEGLQHAGGAKGEEGTQGSIVSDPASMFAFNNPEFIRRMQDKYKSSQPVSEVEPTEVRSRDAVKRILGDAPAKNENFNKFFAHHMPLIEGAKKKAMASMNLNFAPDSIEHDMLGEAGLHGLVQAINDYDHDHPKQASFASHAQNKIVGLMRSALKSADKIPQSLREEHKEYIKNKEKARSPAAPKQESAKVAQPATPPKTEMPAQPKVDLHETIRQTNHPKADEVSNRLKRLDAQKTILRRKPTAGGTSGN